MVIVIDSGKHVWYNTEKNKRGAYHGIFGAALSFRRAEKGCYGERDPTRTRQNLDRYGDRRKQYAKLQNVVSLARALGRSHHLDAPHVDRALRQRPWDRRGDALG